MTAQIGDTVKFRGESYTMIWVEHPEAFNVNWSKYGVKPEMSSTACWRGYFCTYEAEENSLLLKDAYIYCGSTDKYPPINGVEADPASGYWTEGSVYSHGKFEKRKMYEPDFFGHRRYSNLNLPVMYEDKPYTGKIRIAKDFLHKYYIHMGLQKWYAFKTTLELTYENGVLKDVKNLSQDAKKVRSEIDSGKRKGPEEEEMSAWMDAIDAEYGDRHE